ncbi:hypothetical protein K502DRAFT_366952 [Neoconidiobolus thromboides FSU 785]|nr:hypothetical protein K502DRAFT_366952 [Neoconidiobolus thromboides FSU 785]
MNYTAFYIITLILNVFVLTTCLLLLLFATRISIKKNDIKLIILIASLELLLPVLIVADSIYARIQGEKMIYSSAGCTITGFFYVLIFYFEVLFNAFLAIERVLIFKKSRIIKIVYWILVINSIIFLLLLIICAITGAFVRAATNFSCHLDVVNYPLATFTHFFRDFNCFAGVVTIIYCYYEISKEVNGFRKVQDNEFELNSSNKLRAKDYQTAIVKTYITLSIYGILMTTGNVGFLIETILNYLDEQRFIDVTDTLHIVGAIFFAVGFVANSTLILFFHTGIRHEAEKFRDQIKGFFKR